MILDSYSSLQFNMSNVSITRGSQFKMQLTLIRDNLRIGYTFSLIEVRNSVPNEAVSADSINILKSRLDTFWYNQDLKFDREAKISGIGGHSLKFSLTVCNICLIVF